MVKFALSLVALATAASAAIVPVTTSGTTFSFAQWVEDIIANPDTALSPDEAVAAAEAADVVGSAGGLAKRAYCDQNTWKRAPAGDAAGCLDYLTRLGNLGYDCILEETQYNKQMCLIGGAQVVGSKSISPRQVINCVEYARAGGRIFDSCWRADNTVLGSEKPGNLEAFVNILGV